MTRRVFFHTVAWLGYDNQLPFFPLSTPVRGLPFLDIASHPWCQHCSLGARSYEDRTLSLKPAPLLGSREILEVRALLTIDRADLCGLSTAERTGSPVFHTLWPYVVGIHKHMAYIDVMKSTLAVPLSGKNRTGVSEYILFIKFYCPAAFSHI